jgi:large subunit ribosomal protein L19
LRAGIKELSHMNGDIIRQFEQEYCSKNPPQFEIGDTVGVHVKISEGGKERVQVFTGLVIARRGGGVNEKFTVRRIVAGEGVERVFPLHSPKIARIEVIRSGVTNRAKLYYLRQRVGKATRLKERRMGTRAAKADIVSQEAEKPQAEVPAEGNVGASGGEA